MHGIRKLLRIGKILALQEDRFAQSGNLSYESITKIYIKSVIIALASLQLKIEKVRKI
jgi:hypothetical protein